jgi:peptidoglycan hydrolase CwlO-like protein
VEWQIKGETMKNGNFTAIASIVLSIVVAGTAIIVSAVRVESKAESHAAQAEKDLKTNVEVHKELKMDIEQVENEYQILSKDFVEVKTEIKYIRKDMNEILTYIRGLPK